MASAWASNVSLRGVLVEEACLLTAQNANILLDFGTTVDKYLYINTRTHGKLLELKLTDCDLSLGTTVVVSFQGSESLALPGLLAVNSNKGIAIGLEAMDGTALPLNKPGRSYQLNAGTTIVSIKAYIQGEPKALANKSIQRGPISATASFLLNYP